MQALRFPENPIITPELHPSLGTNVNGPSLIRAPHWLKRPLGRYYLYFAHHKGRFIRLATADALAGPWHVHEPGALNLADSGFPTERFEIAPRSKLVKRLLDAGLEEPHIASPDVHVDAAAREFRMYFHGLMPDGSQLTRVALSPDGVRFRARGAPVGLPYFRVFRRAGWHYALGMPGIFFRSKDGIENFERGPALFSSDMRHSALLVRGDSLHVFWTQVGDVPERILCSRIELDPDWARWRESQPEEVLRPEAPWEGAKLPLKPSVRGAALAPVHQLRDPAIFEEDGEAYLLYSIAGERGIAIAKLALDG